jgi:hypothetical protein
MSNGSEGSNNLAGGGGDGLSLSVPGAIAAAPLSRCDEGTEKNVSVVPVQLGQTVNLRLVLCASLFRVRVFRDQTVIFDQSNVIDELNVPVEGLTPGFHSLVWAFLASSSPWKARSEVSVDGNIEFCLKKGSDSSIPSNQLVVLLQVTP